MEPKSAPLSLDRILKPTRTVPHGKAKTDTALHIPEIKDSLLSPKEELHPLLDVDFSHLHQLFEEKDPLYNSFSIPLFTPLKDKARTELLIKRESESMMKIRLDHRLTRVIEETELSGTLKQMKDGFTYLEVSNDFIDKLSHLFAEDGGVLPPFFEEHFYPGAHIGVIARDESLMHPFIKNMPELGEIIEFTIEGCSKIELCASSPFEAIWVLNIHAPKLEWLREKYHLTKWYLSRNFMCILSVKYRANWTKAPVKESVVYMVSPCNVPV